MKGVKPTMMIMDEAFDQLAKSSYEMARRQAALDYAELKKRADALAKHEVERLANEAEKVFRHAPASPTPDMFVSEAGVREALGKSRGFRDLKPLMAYLNDNIGKLAEKAQRFDGLQLDLEDQKDLNDRLAEGIKDARGRLAAANEHLSDVRKYLDELTELAATFGSEASQDLATIVKGLARALGEEA